MLKIKTLIIAFVFSPLIVLNWQLTNLAGSNSPSKGQAGSGSGGGTPPTNYHPSPSKGQAGSGSGGANNGGNPHSSPSKGQAGSGSGGASNGGKPNSPSKGQAGSGSGSKGDNFTVERKSDGIEIRVSPKAGEILKNALPIKNQILSESATKTLLNSLKLPGLSEHTANNLIRVLREIFKTTPVHHKPHSSLFDLKRGQLVASVKAMKPDTTVAEKDTVIKIDPIKLNEAINLYNQIVTEADAKTLKKLSQNSDFVTIGQALQELRTVTK
ncbi:MAG: hypothetical protein EAZ76_14820 [Nostocales cyanobacterium]|nr:MAG: hypothetical protein EAZ87_17980 [Nostocales cyanobacterium]TAF12281.1 MAG: hypothetical protein EAZ76_14820 [Nostocales cyanobacterium]